MSEYDSDDSLSGSEEDDDINVVHTNYAGVDLVDNKLADLRVGGDMGIFRMFEGTFGQHVYEILHEYKPMERSRAIHILWRYMHNFEWSAFLKTVDHGEENFMSDVVGLVYLFGSYFGKDNVDVISFMTHMITETQKPVRHRMVRTSPMLTKTMRAQLIQ